MSRILLAAVAVSEPRMSRYVTMLALVVAGEIVFGLPFHTARFFRPTLLDVFGFSNTQLGDLFAVYGVTAMLAYFPGGALADRFSARFLLTASLVATAIGGLYMATIPGPAMMAALYGYFGITSIFLFWGALIRATREWGGGDTQNIAFGVLEAGRGAVAAGVALVTVGVFAASLPANVLLATPDEKAAAFRTVILVYSASTLGAAALTWFAIPAVDPGELRQRHPLKGMLTVLGRPVVWAQAAVVVCAYCAYKGLDNFTVYAEDVLGMDQLTAAQYSTWAAWLRPVAALAAGIVADRIGTARSLGITFAALIGTFAVLFASSPDAPSAILLVNVGAMFSLTFALRAIYFALLEENATPTSVTGAAVGLTSVIGFTPEVFFGPITGRILDANPGLVGHQNYYLFLAATAVAGVLVIAWMLFLRRKGARELWPHTSPAAPP